MTDLSPVYVPPEGPLKAKIFLIGEAPGREEDLHQRPFIGRAGRLLDHLLFKAGTNRAKVWITNVVKYRPASNRTPTWEEICKGRVQLLEEVGFVEPWAIICLGLTATRGLFGKDKVDTMARMRKKILYFRGIRVFSTYHPAAALRDPAWKDLLLEDLTRGRKWVQKLQ